MENMRGSVEMKVAERNFFTNCPKRTKEDELQTHRGKTDVIAPEVWFGLTGCSCPDHAPQYFACHCPSGYPQDEGLDTLQKQIARVYNELGRYTDTKLSKWNTMRMERQLKTGPKNPTDVHNVNATGVPESEVPPPPTPDISAFHGNIERSLERMVNAALSKDG